MSDWSMDNIRRIYEVCMGCAAKAYGLKRGDLNSAKKKGPIALAKHIAIYVTVTVFDISTYYLSLAIKRDRSGLNHCLSKVEDLRDGRVFDALVERVERTATQRVLASKQICAAQ